MKYLETVYTYLITSLLTLFIKTSLEVFPILRPSDLGQEHHGDSENDRMIFWMPWDSSYDQKTELKRCNSGVRPFLLFLK